MLKSDLFKQREQYTNLFKLTNEVINFIMPYTSHHIHNKTEYIKRYRVLDMRNEYLNNGDKDTAKVKFLEYLYDFQFKLADLNNELSSYKVTLEYFDVEKIINYIGMIQNQIKRIMLAPRLEGQQIYGVADLILEFGIICSSFHSYYLNLELLIQEFSIKEEFIYIRFSKTTDADLNYTEFLLLADFMNSCIEFIFNEYSEIIYVHIDSGSDIESKIEMSGLGNAEVKVKNTLKDNIKEIFNGIRRKDQNNTATLIKLANATRNLINDFFKDNLKILELVSKKKRESNDVFYKEKLTELFDKYTKFSENNLLMSIESLSQNNNPSLALEKLVVKQITDQSAENIIE